MGWLFQKKEKPTPFCKAMKIKFLTPFLDFGQISWKKSLDPLKMSLGALWFTDFYST